MVLELVEGGELFDKIVDRVRVFNRVVGVQLITCSLC
jgi:hypothetical protein